MISLLFLLFYQYLHSEYLKLLCYTLIHMIHYCFNITFIYAHLLLKSKQSEKQTYEL